MGTTIREILEEYAGGMRDGFKLRGLIPGGASTDFLIERHLDVQMDFDCVQKAGSRLGTGTMIVLDDKTCPVGMVCEPGSTSSPRNPAAGARPAGGAALGRARCCRPSKTARGSRATWRCWSCIPSCWAPGQHVLRPGAGRHGAAAERAEILPGRFRAAHSREALPVEITYGDDLCRQQTVRSETEGRTCSRPASRLGFNLPYFCWHPALGSVGACRQCAVKQFKDEKDTHGQDRHGLHDAGRRRHAHLHRRPGGVEFRASVIEWLMVNHPHDCPVCDEGGECHLQDMTVMTGHVYRRYRFKKRTLPQSGPGAVRQPRDEPLHPVLPLRALLPRLRGRATTSTSSASHNTVYFGRHEDGVLENEFSGNLVEVCPTGVFTDKTLKQPLHAQVGPADRAFDLRALRPGLQHHPGRALRHAAADPQPLQRRGERLFPLRPRALSATSSSTASGASASRCCDGAGDATLSARRSRAAARCARLSMAGTAIGIGSPRASLEANFALRTLVGPEQFLHGRLRRSKRSLIDSDDRHPAEAARARSPSLREVEDCDAVLVLGEDVTNTAPMLALALRQSVRQQPMEIAEKLHIPLWEDHGVRDAHSGRKKARCSSPRRMRPAWTTSRRHVSRGARRYGPPGLCRGPRAGCTAPPVADLPDEMRALAERYRRGTASRQNGRWSIAGPSLRQRGGDPGRGERGLALCMRANAPAVLDRAGVQQPGAGASWAASRSSAASRQSREGRRTRSSSWRTTCIGGAMLRRGRTSWNARSTSIVLDHLANPHRPPRPKWCCPRRPSPRPTARWSTTKAARSASSRFRAARATFRKAGVAGLMERRSAGDSSWMTFSTAMVAQAHARILRPVLDAAPPAAFRMAGAEDPAPAAPLQRAHRHAREHRRQRAQAAGGSGFAARFLDGRLRRTAAGGADPALLGAGLELGPGPQQIPGGDRRPAARRGSGSAADRAAHRKRPAATSTRSRRRFEPREAEWLVVPLHHIFGSEELSVLTPGIAERAPEAVRGLNADDAASFTDGGQADAVQLVRGGSVARLPCKIQRRLLPRASRACRSACRACRVWPCPPGANCQRSRDMSEALCA